MLLKSFLFYIAEPNPVDISPNFRIKEYLETRMNFSKELIVTFGHTPYAWLSSLSEAVMTYSFS